MVPPTLPSRTKRETVRACPRKPRSPACAADTRRIWFVFRVATVSRSRAAWLVTRPFAEFAPERHVGRIAPRPIVMINGIDDPQMPRSAVEALYAAAREPKTLIWLRTGHLMPEDSALVRALVDTALTRLPALQDSQ